MVKVPLSELPSPRSLAKSLYISGEEFVALLESGPGFPDRARYTIVAWGIREEVRASSRVYDELQRLYRGLQRYEGPFGGDLAIGFVAYDVVVEIEPSLTGKIKTDNAFPLGVFVVPENVVIYDNLLKRAYVVGRTPAISMQSEGRPLRQGRTLYRTDDEYFKRSVAEALRRIKDGEIFQVVLSRSEVFEISGNLFNAYERLATLNPSPYMYFFALDDMALIGTSPELLVKVQGDIVETHPIAGTRPRGSTEREDLKLEEDMLSDEKELAEHMMLVDLARNDVGKISRFGTVKVNELLAIEKYSHVQHLVSRVSGVLEPKYNIVDGIWALHPAGTVSGAPKVRAMEIIGELEDRPRGPYAGGFGVMAPSGGELAIVIRTLIVKGNEAKIQAGAGVVYDSTPERELRETEYKMAHLKAIWT
ncbi:anthranilate synthase component I family protein [Thermoproteus tenax]|uniref:anthranilate synthase n=1 Tax=Thermoproteus tenax (strain ATCC 35583 / DSM 2078 / JCM 9277 / NBRC 100435 / Kra 1) TaxID=768679 RepID=G4RLL6_THETK|nr:chorismate-binding protein [Thermoproteus tenax]CCC82461.1 anthranilate synthase component I [Thermoproteus tenax Kra 1]